MREFPEDERRILGQSYRLPRTVHALSQQWITQIAERVEKPFAPRPEDGAVRYLPVHYGRAELILDDAADYLAAGKRVMILASCAYMLTPILAAARRLGIPFHNPYRPREVRWNPLRAGRGGTAVQRMLAYLRPDPCVWGDAARMWTGADLAQWAGPLAGWIVGGKAALTALDGRQPVPPAWFDAHLDPAGIGLMDISLDEYLRAQPASAIEHVLYPLAVAEAQGARALREAPQLVIGTIHSVKGGEAEVVYLSPELSPAQHADWENTPDPVVRQYYVGITRPRETLVLCDPRPRAHAVEELLDLALAMA
jgi:superfamily I DNA/RNA helicase